MLLKEALKDVNNTIMPPNLLTLENLLDINEQIKIRASNDGQIEYTGSGDYPIKIYQLEKLIEYTPENRTIVDVAAYYLKNIILLQAFPDANHRTALTAIEIFLEKNGYSLDYSAVEAYQFQKELYKRRLHEYGTYEEGPISVLKEEDNHVFSLCFKFIKDHIEK
jgi:prophage maintenance system killer protein